MDISPKYSFSQISNNSINYNNNLNENEQNLTKNHPLFFSYKIVSKYENDKNNNDNLIHIILNFIYFYVIFVIKLLKIFSIKTTYITI